jgi:hypothetical protein
MNDILQLTPLQATTNNKLPSRRENQGKCAIYKIRGVGRIFTVFPFFPTVNDFSVRNECLNELAQLVFYAFLYPGKINAWTLIF